MSDYDAILKRLRSDKSTVVVMASDEANEIADALEHMAASRDALAAVFRRLGLCARRRDEGDGK